MCWVQATKKEFMGPLRELIHVPCIWDRVLLLLLSHFSHVRLHTVPWTTAHQPPLSAGSLRREYWGGLPFPPPGDLPDPGTEPASLASLALVGGHP